MDKLSAKEPHPKRGKHAKETEASSTVRHAQDVPVDVDGPGVVGYHSDVSGKVYVAAGDSTNSNMTIYTATATYDFGVRLLGNQRLWGRLHGGRQLLDLLRASRQLRKRLPHVQNDWLTLWVSSKLTKYVPRLVLAHTVVSII